MQVLVSHILNRIQHACGHRILLIRLAIGEFTSHLKLILPMAQRPRVVHRHIDVLPVIQARLCALDHLILLHLRQSFLMITLILAQNASCNTSVCVVWDLATPSVLILTVTLHALHVKVTPIEAIGHIRQVIHIIQ